MSVRVERNDFDVGAGEYAEPLELSSPHAPKVRLVLHVVLKEKVEIRRLKEELSRAIGERMNPLFAVHDVVVVDALPRTATNKIVRRELRDSYWGVAR